MKSPASSSPSTPASNGYEYDCESYKGADEASLDKMFPGWRDRATGQTEAEPATAAADREE